jgi:hypothetical protein
MRVLLPVKSIGINRFFRRTEHITFMRRGNSVHHLTHLQRHPAFHEAQLYMSDQARLTARASIADIAPALR